MSRTIEIATTARARMKGLLGREGLPAGKALLILPCKAIHTLGMKFAIDVRFYDKQGQLTREALQVPPCRWWVWGGWRAHAVLECAAGDSTFHNTTTLEELRHRNSKKGPCP